MPLDRNLVVEAKRLEKLQAKRRKLRKDLRDIEESIKLTRKFIKGLLTPRVNNGPDDQLPPRWKGRIK